MTTLSGSFPADAPGLPRGRGRLSPDQVRAAQRHRILRAAIAAFAEQGLHATTVAEIVTRARVSRPAFYALYRTKEECLIAAVESGSAVLLPQISAATTNAWPRGFAAAITAIVHEYLRVCASEPEFTRAWTLELPQAGPAAVRLRNEYFDALATTLRTAHHAHLAQLPEATALPEASYLALVGGCHELFYRHLTVSPATTLPDLADPMTRFLLDAMALGTV